MKKVVFQVLSHCSIKFQKFKRRMCLVAFLIDGVVEKGVCLKCHAGSCQPPLFGTP